MRYWEIISEWGKIVPGVNTTVDVKPGEISRQGAKMGFSLDANGLPPLIYGGQQPKSSPPKMKKEKGQTFYGKDGTPPNKKAPRVVKEDNVIPFNRPKPQPAKEIDHGNGLVSKPFSVNDLVNDPPVRTEDIRVIKGWKDEPTVIHVTWTDYRSAEFPIFQVARILKLRNGETITLDAYGDNRTKIDPARNLTVTRQGAQFIVKLSHFLRHSDGKLEPRTTAMDYTIDAQDFVIAAQEALRAAKAKI
jgi:hypothetical protein